MASAEASEYRRVPRCEPLGELTDYPTHVYSRAGKDEIQPGAVVPFARTL